MMKHIKSISATETPASAVELPIWGTFAPLGAFRAAVGVLVDTFQLNTPGLDGFNKEEIKNILPGD